MQRRIPNLTALRFLLALLVIIFHIPLFMNNRGLPAFDSLSIFHRGSEAVYMFFSLSGFLIIRQLYIEKEKFGQINLKNFLFKTHIVHFSALLSRLNFRLIYYHHTPLYGF